jgi:hypothetical protein
MKIKLNEPKAATSQYNLILMKLIIIVLSTTLYLLSCNKGKYQDFNLPTEYIQASIGEGSEFPYSDPLETSKDAFIGQIQTIMWMKCKILLTTSILMLLN